MMKPIEQSFQCPWCFETISMIVEPEVNTQTYIEDCEVCCRPIRVSFALSDDAGEDGDENCWFESQRSE